MATPSLSFQISHDSILNYHEVHLLKNSHAWQGYSHVVTRDCVNFILLDWSSEPFHVGSTIRIFTEVSTHHSTDAYFALEVITCILNIRCKRVAYSPFLLRSIILAFHAAFTRAHSCNSSKTQKYEKSHFFSAKFGIDIRNIKNPRWQVGNVQIGIDCNPQHKISRRGLLSCCR